MDPFAKKMVQGSVAFGSILLLMFVILTGVYLHLRPRCNEQVINEINSGDHQWKAAILERRCGDEPRFFTHVNLRPAGEETIRLGYFSGKAEEGEVLTIEQDAMSADVSLLWTGPNQLTISCTDCASQPTTKRTSQWGAVALRYDLKDSTPQR
ncbi:MAG TPA: hypothetical protein VKZ53_17980 [Candidatus Angelobacter sp.]|nr:hypothetical protein [Candidatus Angelobacter sp.]